ncbi:MAG: LURP-one-related/scramblase family protein [Oscillospiraceae bacterium]
MKLYIKQRIFSWTDSYDIYDENMNRKYTAKADFLALGHRIRIFDLYGCEVGHIEEKLLRLFAEFDVYIGGRWLGRIKKKFSLFIPKYDIDYNGWDIDGDFFGWNYQVRQPNGLVAATISKELLHLSDTYVIDIFDDSDEINVLLLVAAIDAANCSNNNS